MSELRKWLPLVVHPQTGMTCWQYSRFHDVIPWPEDGFSYPGTAEPQFWPVPRLKDARLVDCFCGKTGLQPATAEAVARYVPGAELVDEGDRQSITFSPVLASVSYPTGSGEDEVDRDSG